MQPRAGLLIGPYRLVEHIGEGGMGVVWRARDTVLDRDVAIKLLPEAFVRDPDRLARFQREARAVAALSHPGILAIYGFGDEDGTPYAVTELLEGHTLRELLAAGVPEASRVTEIALQAARALAAAHDRGVVHRDLKPENLYLTTDGRVKILDFGLSLLHEAGYAADGSGLSTQTQLTTPGTLLGTVPYLSPEQVLGRPADARSDLFAFGAMLHEMLTGRQPFHRESTAATMAAILHDDVPVVSGSALGGVIRRCLEKRPEDRYESAHRLVQALEAAGAVALRRRGRIVAAIAAGAVVLALGIGWGLRSGRDRPGPGRLSSVGEPLSSVTEANEDFERALLFLRTQLDIPRAQGMLDRAIAQDPGFASARAVRGLMHLIAIHEGFANDPGLVYAAESEMRELLARDAGQSSAHGVLGAALLYLNRKEPARQELEEALRLNPDSQPGAAWSMLDDQLGGNFASAEARARGLLQFSPLFWAARISLADSLFYEGRSDEARRELEKVLEQDPGNRAAVRSLVRLLLHDGETSRAREVWSTVPPDRGTNFRMRLTLALLLASEGDRDRAVALLDEETRKYAELAMFASSQVAEIFALCGRNEEALDWLDRAARGGDERAEWFRRDPFLAGLRDEPRFVRLLESIERSRETTGRG